MILAAHTPATFSCGNGGTISRKSRRPDNVYLSTSKADVTTSQAGQQALYLRDNLKDFGYQQNTTTEIYKEILSYVDIHESSVRRNFPRHIDICR